MDGTDLAKSRDHAALSFISTRLRSWGEQLDVLEPGQKTHRYRRLACASRPAIAFRASSACRVTSAT